MAAQLEEAAVDLQGLRNHLRQSIARMLQSFDKDKVLILDKSLTGPLGVVAEMAMLKKLGAGEIYHLGIPVTADSKDIIFFVRPTIHNMNCVADQVLKDYRAKPPVMRKYNLFMTPRPTKVCAEVLTDRGVLGDVTVKGLHLGFIPIDADVLSLENERIWREVFLKNDIDGLWNLARSLIKLQVFFGVIPTIYAKGSHAKTVVKLMKRIREESDPEMYTIMRFSNRHVLFDIRSICEPVLFDSSVSEISECVILDRTVDMATPLMTQMTYEGKIDEHIGIKNSCATVDASITATKQNKKGTEEYKEIRDLHVYALGQWLHTKAGEVRKRYDEVKKSSIVQQGSDTTIGQMKDVVKKLKTTSAEHNWLQIHSNLAHHLNSLVFRLTFDQKIEKEISMVGGSDSVEDFVEAQISKANTFSECVRLFALMTNTRYVAQKKYTFFLNEIVQAFGYDHLFALRNLEQVGVLPDEGRRYNCPWTNVRRRFDLYKDEVDAKKQDGLFYVFGGSKKCEMGCRVRFAWCRCLAVRYATNGNWLKVKDALDQLPGGVVETTQPVKSRPTVEDGGRRSGSSESKKKLPTSLVVFVGGVTYAEISALRKLGKMKNRNYIIATSHFTNGNKLINALKEPLMTKPRAGGSLRK
eukprot:jgi/Bigna1/71652/fgenesh1_pg.16_\